MADELVRMERINKYFGHVQALNDVTLSVRKNEIVGLLGDNGAGKSTLIKILSGALRPDSGEIYIHGGGTDGDWTRGCIGLNDDEMTELFEMTEIGTPVLVLP